MTHRIEKMPGFTVVGLKKFIKAENGENLKTIPQMWKSLTEEQWNTLYECADGEPRGMLGVCAGMRRGGFDYWVAAASTKPCPEGFRPLDIPAAEWAKFEAAGPMPQAIQDAWRYIFDEWLPRSGYEHAPAPEIEWYSDGDPASADYKSEVWIPVLKTNLED